MTDGTLLTTVPAARQPSLAENDAIAHGVAAYIEARSSAGG